jgi:hypothetical protein
LVGRLYGILVVMVVKLIGVKVEQAVMVVLVLHCRGEAVVVVMLVPVVAGQLVVAAAAQVVEPLPAQGAAVVDMAASVRAVVDMLPAFLEEPVHMPRVVRAEVLRRLPEAAVVAER